MILAVLKLPFVSVVVTPVDFTVTMENICDKFSLVDRFSAWNLVVGTFRIDPHQFTVTLHARVNEFSYVVTTIGPFELTLSLNPRILQLSSIYVDFCDTMSTSRETFPNILSTRVEGI